MLYCIKYYGNINHFKNIETWLVEKLALTYIMYNLIYEGKLESHFLVWINFNPSMGK